MARRDDERAALARDVHERRLPGVAVVGGRRDVDLDAGLVEREARERHVVLPADQPADAAEAGLDGAQAAPVALAPDRAARGSSARACGGAARACRRARGRAASCRSCPAARLDLVHAGDEPDAELLRGRAEPPLGGRADGDRVLREPRERLLRAVVLPAGERLRPARGRVDRHERLREDDELRAVAGRLGGERSSRRASPRGRGSRARPARRRAIVTARLDQLQRHELRLTTAARVQRRAEIDGLGDSLSEVGPLTRAPSSLAIAARMSSVLHATWSSFASAPPSRSSSRCGSRSVKTSTCPT